MISPRPFCYICRRARVLCVCEDVKPVPTRTRVVFLQHAEEAWNQVGTARLAHLSLSGSILIEGRDFKEDPRLEQALQGSGEKLLLYPTRDAVPIEDLEQGIDRTLVVVDGTWAQARNVVNHTPDLRGLTRVRLARGERSRYRIRLQPRAECVSTLEAAVRALAVLEGDASRFEPLLAAFDRMVDRHIACAAAAGRKVVTDVNRKKAMRPLPPELRQDDVVLVHGETLNARDPLTGDFEGDLIQWCALRLATGEVFDKLLATRALTDAELAYLRLPSLYGALDAAAFRTAWARFVRPGDTYFTWGFYAPNAAGRILGARLTPLTDLRRTTKHVLNTKVRRPEDALFELHAEAPKPIARGRCGERLASVREIVFSLRALSPVRGAS